MIDEQEEVSQDIYICWICVHDEVDDVDDDDRFEIFKIRWKIIINK